MKFKITKKRVIIICGAVLLLILGALYFDYYAWNTYLFGSLPPEFGSRRLPLFEILMDKKREKQENKRKEEEETEKAKKLEEYLKNKKNPPEYLSLLGKEKFYFVSYSKSSSSENGIYEVEIINNAPVLYRIELINGKKIKLYDIILDEHFDSPYLPDNRSWVYNCDFAFFNRYSDNKDNLDNISSYLKFLEKDGEIKIWAHDGIGNSGLMYETKSKEDILSEFNSIRPKKEIKYTGKYILEADGGGNSASDYIYFINDYLIYHREYRFYDMETETMKADVEYEMYYKKITNST